MSFTLSLYLGDISCTASSEYSNDWRCDKAFDGVLAIGMSKNAWASKGDGVGGWIQAQFKGRMAISKLRVLQRVKEQDVSCSFMYSAS